MSDPLLTEALKMAQHECHLIHLTQWRSLVIILIGGTHEQHLDDFRRHKLPKSDQVALADYIRNDTRHIAAVTLQSQHKPRRQFIYFPKRPDVTKSETANVVAHELLHVAIHVLKTAGVKLNDGSEETYTYLLGYLIEQFWLKVPPPTAR